MSRVTLVVDKNLLKACINEVESKGPLSNRSALHVEVCKLYNSKITNGDKEITFSIVALRMKEFNLECITPKGKRGRAGGVPRVTGTGIRVPKAEKFKGNKVMREYFARLRLDTPERFLPILERAEKGSRTAAVKLNCLRCVCFNTKIISTCEVDLCDLWPFRPYQSKLELNEDGIVEEPEEVEEIEEEKEKSPE